jgi:hypothetical protein
MTDTRCALSLMAGLIGLIPTCPARATTAAAKTDGLGPRLRLTMPELRAQASPPPVPSPESAETSGALPVEGADQEPDASLPDARPYTLDYRPGEPIPPGYRVTSHPHRAMLAAGSTVFGIHYAVSLLIASSRTEASATSESFLQVPYDPKWLYVPVIGPWVALATSFRSLDCRNPYSTTSSYFYGECENAKRDLGMSRMLLTFDGILQGVGATLAVWGFVRRWHQLVLTDELQVQVLPILMGGGEGLALVGRFGAL